MNKAQLKLLQECADKSAEWGRDERGMYFALRGFAKSGTLRLYPVADAPNIEMTPLFTAVSTRNSEVTTVRTYIDIVGIAYDWYERYRDLGWGVPQEWEDDFRKRSWI